MSDLETQLALMVRGNSKQKTLFKPPSKREQKEAEKQFKGLLTRKRRSQAMRKKFQKKLKDTARKRKNRARGHIFKEQLAYYTLLEKSKFFMYEKKYGKTRFLLKEEWDESGLDEYFRDEIPKVCFKRVDESRREFHLDNIQLIDKATKEVVWRPTNEQIQRRVPRGPSASPQKRVRRLEEDLRHLRATSKKGASRKRALRKEG